MTIREFIDEYIIPYDERTVELSSETIYLLYELKSNTDGFKKFNELEAEMRKSKIPTSMKDGFRTFMIDEATIVECLT